LRREREDRVLGGGMAVCGAGAAAGGIAARIGVGRRAVIQASKLELRIMRHELTDHEWAAIKVMLPNKPRGIPRVNDRRVLNGMFWVLRSGAPWRDLPRSFGPIPLATTASSGGDGLASGTGSWMPFLLLTTPPFK
jgi:hypothetical protein